VLDDLECVHLPEVLALAAGELHGEAALEAEAHLRECARCSAELKAGARLSALLAATDPAPAPPRPDPLLRAALLARCEESLRPVAAPVRKPLGRRLAFGLAAACAAAALVVLIRPAPEQQAQTASPAPPVQPEGAGGRVVPPTVPQVAPRVARAAPPSPGVAAHRPRRRGRRARRESDARPRRTPAPLPPRTPAPDPPQDRVVIIVENTAEPPPRQETISITASGDPTQGGAVVITHSEEPRP
jgi:hypothetical protein